MPAKQSRANSREMPVKNRNGLPTYQRSGRHPQTRCPSLRRRRFRRPRKIHQVSLMTICPGFSNSIDRDAAASVLLSPLRFTSIFNELHEQMSAAASCCLKVLFAKTKTKLRLAFPFPQRVLAAIKLERLPCRRPSLCDLLPLCHGFLGFGPLPSDGNPDRHPRKKLQLGLPTKRLMRLPPTRASRIFSRFPAANPCCAFAS